MTRACICGATNCQRHGGQSNWAKRRYFGRDYTRSGWAINPPPANGTYGGDWPRIRLQVLKRDGYQCQLRYADICVGRASQVDHIVQPEAGGTNDLSNLRAVCVKCHRRRTGQQGALAKQRRSKHPQSRKEK
jgi:5-methylcytosine-specific restriction protein A